MAVRIVYFFTYFAEALCLWQYAVYLFHPKYKKRAEFAVLSCLYFILFLLHSLFPDALELHIVMFFLASFLFLSALYYTTWFSALFHALFLTVTMSSSEFIAYRILSFFTPDFFYENNFFSNLTILAIFSKIVYFFVLYTFPRLFVKKGTSAARIDKAPLLLFSIPAASIAIIAVWFFACRREQLSHSLNLTVSISAILIFTINLLIFTIYSYSQKKSQDLAQLQLQAQKEHDLLEYYQMLSQKNETQHILIHDMKKHLESLALLNENNKNEQIAEYLDRIIKMPELKGSHFCSNELLNAILSRYQNLCMEKQISFCTNIDSSMDFLSEYDLTRLFGNLLDNALEAAMQVPGSFIDLCISRQEDTFFLVITLINSCKNDPFHGKKNARPATGKPDKANHGYGLKSVQKVVETHHGNLKMYYTPETQSFHTVILLKDKAGNLHAGSQ